MNFSIMLPTIRWEFLPTVVESILTTASDRPNLEIRLAIDENDCQTLGVANNIKKTYPNDNIFIHTREHHYSLVKGYYNWLAVNFCVGKYIIATNDDALFTKSEWDIKAFERLENYLKGDIIPNEVVYGITQDMEDPMKRTHLKFIGTDFPIISKKAVELISFFFNPYFDSAGADPNIAEFYHNLGRVVDLRDIVVIHHKHPLFFKIAEKYDEMKRNKIE